MRSRFAARWGLAWALSLTACNDPPASRVLPQATEPSPNASILPAPLASDVETKRALPLRSASVPLTETNAGMPSASPRALREDALLPVDPLRPEQGLRLSARFSWLGLPPFPRLPEQNAEASQRLRDAQALDLTIELSPQGRLRAVLASDAFVLPRGSELRARLEYLGHVLLWDSGRRYTLLPAGTLRAVLTEHRADAAPLVDPRVSAAGSGRMLGLPTTRTELVTPLGRLVLEQAPLPGAGSSGVLICRLLGEFITAEPIHDGCDASKVPLRGEVFSAAGGHLLFEVLRIDRDQALEESNLTTTPASAELVKGALPPLGPPIVLPEPTLAELRTRAAAREERVEPLAPKSGLLLQNRSEALRYVLLDGVLVARLLPRSEVHLDGLLQGKYGLMTLDFMGDDATPLRVVALPARVALGDDVEAPR